MNLLLVTGSYLLLSCGRPTSDYDVSLYGAGTNITDLQGPSEPMGGVVEYLRVRLHGSNLGHALTGLYGDQPRADGSSFVLSTAMFAFPPHTSFDSISMYLTKAPQKADTCFQYHGARSEAYSTEYVDVGDKIMLQGDGVSIPLHRDPTIYPRPAGENWYVGYSSGLLPVLSEYPHAFDTWKSAGQLRLSAPGTIPPDDATVGAIPYPIVEHPFVLPAEVPNIQFNGLTMRAPYHAEEADDPVYMPAPWVQPVTMTWSPDEQSSALTLSIRLLGKSPEASCASTEECGVGFTCETGSCYGVDGSTGSQLAEVVCHVANDGSFDLNQPYMQQFYSSVSGVHGAIVVVSTVSESQISKPPDVLSHNGKRIEAGPIRLRAADMLVGRIEVQP